MIKPAYSVSFLLSINIFVWQNVLYFPNDPSSYNHFPEEEPIKSDEINY